MGKVLFTFCAFKSNPKFLLIYLKKKCCSFVGLYFYDAMYYFYIYFYDVIPFCYADIENMSKLSRKIKNLKNILFDVYGRTFFIEQTKTL